MQTQTRELSRVMGEHAEAPTLATRVANMAEHRRRRREGWPRERCRRGMILLKGPKMTTPVATITGDAIAAKFARLATRWKAECGPKSSIIRISMHPVYRQNIGVGEAVLPLILKELECSRSLVLGVERDYRRRSGAREQSRCHERNGQGLAGPESSTTPRRV